MTFPFIPHPFITLPPIPLDATHHTYKVEFVIRMPTKLTLLLNERAIQRAKQEAKTRGTSVSRMVEDYFMAAPGGNPSPATLPPLTASLAGRLRTPRRLSLSGRREYRDHLEAKHW